MDFHNILNEYYAAGGYPNAAIFNFLQSTITKRQTGKLVGWG
jgi:hypothetical protein